MAKVQMNTIGERLPAPAGPDETRLRALETQLAERRAQLKLGWGEVYQQRTQARGKLTVWQRVESLADNPAEIRPILTFVNWGDTFGGKTSPSAGVVTAFVRIHDRWTMVIANDNTVASGSWWPRSPEKIIRAQEIALNLKLPVVYLVDCSGLFLPEQSRAFPGKYGAGHIFFMNSRLNAAGVAQVAGVFGDCIAGGGYMPIISDRVYMTEQAYMVIAGAALIQGAKSQNLSSLDIGGADVHVHLSNCADERVPDDETAIARIRDEIGRLPSSAVAFHRHGGEAAPPRFATAELEAILPSAAAEPYDARQVIARLVDDSLFHEVLQKKGLEVITGIGRINGLYVGLVANYQGLFPHPDDPSRKRAGGILYKEGVAKLSLFSRACNDDGLPIIWLQDISGFDIGAEAEKIGLLGYGSSLIHANSNNTTPMITVLLRKASGAGYYAMAGLPYEPVLQLSTPLTRLAVMEGKTLAIGAFRTKLDDNFQILATDPAERAEVERAMAEVSGRIEKDMDPYASARQLDSDEIVKLSEIRAYLETVVECAYQNHGTRRVKNPRIWSIHDLEAVQ